MFDQTSAVLADKSSGRPDDLENGGARASMFKYGLRMLANMRVNAVM
jgi:hypothetical protein